MKPFVSIIIVNWNGKPLLKDCLTSIQDYTNYSNFNVIVVDNGSNDGSLQMVRQNFPSIEIIENETNLYFAKANNQGIKKALKEGVDYVFLLNNDTIVTHSNWLTKMVELAEMCKSIGIVGCKLIYPDGKIQHAGGAITAKGTFHYGYGKVDDGSYDRVKNVDYVTGAAFLIKRQLIDRIGLFDETFSPLYYEETDYCVRAKKAGFRIIYNPQTTIMHLEGTTTKKIFWKNYAWHKNRIRFILLNFPIKWILRAVVNEPKILVKSLFRKQNSWQHLNLASLLKVYYVNLKSLKEILQKRRRRMKKREKEL